MGVNAAEHARWNDEAWTRSWPRREILTDSVTPVLLQALDLRRGERVLDVGCGGGRATLAAWAQVQPGGSVVGADISEPLLVLAAERGAGIGAVTWQRADIQTDRIAGEPFDVVMSQFGVMFFDEPVTAFANIRSHMRAGARIAFACWQTLDRNPWFVGPVLAPFLPSAPPPGPGTTPVGPFALGDGERVRAILAEAGFADIGVDQRSHEVDVPDSALMDDAQLTFLGVSADAIEAARSAVAAALERFRSGNDRRRFPLAFQIVTARLGR